MTAPIVKVIHHNQPFGIKSPALAKKRKSGAPAHPPTKKYSYDAGWFGMGAGCSEAEHDARRETKIILRDSENMSEQPVSLHSPSHSFDQLVIKPAPDVFGK